MIHLMLAVERRYGVSNVVFECLPGSVRALVNQIVVFAEWERRRNVDHDRENGAKFRRVAVGILKLDGKNESVPDFDPIDVAILHTAFQRLRKLEVARKLVALGLLVENLHVGVWIDCVLVTGDDTLDLVCGDPLWRPPFWLDFELLLLLNFGRDRRYDKSFQHGD